MDRHDLALFCVALMWHCKLNAFLSICLCFSIHGRLHLILLTVPDTTKQNVMKTVLNNSISRRLVTRLVTIVKSWLLLRKQVTKQQKRHW